MPFGSSRPRSAPPRFAHFECRSHTDCTRKAPNALQKLANQSDPPLVRTRVKGSNTKLRKMLASSSFDDPPYDAEITEGLS